ncbi:helix-turn-helix domain-containing protein [Anaerocolumna xylanovorans]|uniref:DNA binding domain-containing protein, excisionase family n=1 Tax=Anaerocolumna xylanovorans DSM 12503 TaxID=1121345 RepID=A0A1M7XWS4_9FIRM|nr:helix-turn-helix domain-containing protein [Anaerocolumna xylanovorans]SHO43067.1 DNA binding domain-containing protein, excisionase family [Anaerocolumna xylanovorans DSM 12503]
MEEKFYTIYQVADLLGMHHKTIRKFIAEGKLGAAKAGKQWRISDNDLSAFMENSNVKAEEKIEGNTSLDFTTKTMDAAKTRINVSTVIDIDDIDKNQYMRVSNTLIASMNSKDLIFQGSTLNVKYYESESRLKILLWGSVKFIEEMLDMVTMLVESV